MRILIISDIHANLTALTKVLDEAGEFDAVWCLGDLVGYGPDPNECVQLVRKLPNLACVIGNHDAAALNLIDVNSFNPEARDALAWTRKELTPESLQFLTSLPETIVVQGVTLSHGSPRHPVWEYLLDTQTAALNFAYFDTPLCFVGHTHLPVIYTQNSNHHFASMEIPRTNQVIQLQAKSIVNPGSVGQPRDRDPRAAFAIFDDEHLTWDYRRVAYNIEEVQSRMLDLNLPERHILRLTVGW